MQTRNRIHNCSNPFQGKYKRVLCVCSAGLLRSPTTALVLSQEPYNFNTRAVGITPDFALIPVEEVLLAWADEIVCMDEWQKDLLELRLAKMFRTEKECRVISLDIPDSYSYRDLGLMELIKERYNFATRENSNAD